jgi:hypothetical protein
MNELKAINGRVYCDMCNQSFIDEAACEPFLKDGETVVDCIMRNRKDTDMVLRLLAQEKSRVDQLRAKLDRLREAHDLARQDCWNLTEKVIPEIRAERDRLREALERIATAGGYDAPDLENMARAALQEKGDE